MEIEKAVIVFFAKYFGYVLIAGLLVFILNDWRKRLFLVVQMIIAAILSRGIITEVIRFFWHRDRPYIGMGVDPLITPMDSASFPSGHATFFFALGAVLYFYNKPLGILFLAGSVIVGVARILALVHWPSDIIAGALIGMACGWLVWKSAILYRRQSNAN